MAKIDEEQARSQYSQAKLAVRNTLKPGSSSLELSKTNSRAASRSSSGRARPRDGRPPRAIQKAMLPRISCRQMAKQTARRA